MADKATCYAKHTKFQPTDKEWKCPKCGDTENFCISSSVEDADEMCGKIHVEDEIECSSCGYCGSGQTVTRRLAKIENLQECPTCKGKGMVACG